MFKIMIIITLCLVLVTCGTQEPQQAARPGSLAKISVKNQSDVERLRQLGAEIIVQEPDYVIARMDSVLSAQSLKLEVFNEKDLVHRLIKVTAASPDELHTVMNSGMDVWEIKGDTVIGRAFDIYIEKIRAKNIDVEILAEDAGNMEVYEQ